MAIFFRRFALSLALCLGGCAWVQVPPGVGEGLRNDPTGQKLAWMAQQNPALDRLDRMGEANTVLVPDDAQWPDAQWNCWRAHPDQAGQEAARYVLALSWAPQLRSPAALRIESLSGERHTMAVPLEGPATVDGVGVTQAYRWANGTLIHLAHPLPPRAGSPCS